MATAEDVLNVAAGEVGYYAPADPEPGSKYGRWLAELWDEPWIAGPSNIVWWCCIFVSWCLDQAGQECDGFPSYNCDSSRRDARGAGLVLDSKYDAEPGDIVLFDWGGDGSCDHIGFVVSNEGDYISTIEGNTSGSDWGSQSAGNGVHRRTRSWGSINCIIRPPYGSSPEPEPEPKKPTQKEDEMICLIKPDGQGYMLYYNGAEAVKLSHPDQMAALQEIYRKTHDGAEMPVFEYGTKEAPWTGRLLQTCTEVKGADPNKWLV